MSEAINQPSIERARTLELVSDIVSAYVSKNAMQPNALSDLIREVHNTLLTLDVDVQTSAVPAPIVPIKKSITDDFLICLEDGKKFKSLKRHLRAKYNLTPEAYREKWGLPFDYPMVAPSYARKRSALAKDMGLGRAAK